MRERNDCIHNFEPVEKFKMERFDMNNNLGIGIALVGSLKGYQVKIVMPENMSEERKKLIRTIGADLILTPAGKSIQGAVDRVQEMQKEDSRVFVCQQFENPDNPRIHYCDSLSNAMPERFHKTRGPNR